MLRRRVTQAEDHAGILSILFGTRLGGSSFPGAARTLGSARSHQKAVWGNIRYCSVELRRVPHRGRCGEAVEGPPPGRAPELICGRGAASSPAPFAAAGNRSALMPSRTGSIAGRSTYLA